MADIVGDGKITPAEKTHGNLDVFQIMGGGILASWDLAFIETSIFKKRRKPNLEQVAKHDGHARGHEEVIASSHFGDHEHGGDGNARGRSENGSHADDDKDRGGMM